MRKYLVLAAAVILSLVAASPVSAAPPEDNGKPVPATDIQVVKK